MVGTERFLDRLATTCKEVDSELFGVLKDIAPSVAIAFRELGNELLDPRLRHCESALLLAARERNLLAEGLLKDSLEIWQERWRPRFAPWRVAAPSGRELEFLWRPARAHLVFLLGIGRCRRGRGIRLHLHIIRHCVLL